MLVAGAAALSLAALAPGALGADARVSTFTQSTRPTTGGKLLLSVRVTGTATERLYLSVVYSPGTAGRCAPTPQQQTGTHIVDQVPVDPGPYDVQQTSAPLASGLYTVCGYTFRGVPPDQLYFVDGNGDIVGTDSSGGGGSGGGAATAVAVATARQGTRYVYGGRTLGAKTGTVRVQRQVGSSWRTLATAAVRNGRWRVLAPGRSGWTVRAALTAKGKRPSTSRPTRLR